jgi:F0F1-type ATP synthase assembly protein I
VQSKQGWDLADDFVPDQDVEDAKVTGMAVGLGFAIVATLVVMIVLGLVLDSWLDKSPLFTLLGIAIGLIGAGYQLYELVLVSDKHRRSGPLGRSMAQRMESKQQRDTQDPR